MGREVQTYFIHSQATGMVKIGISKNPAGRMSDLQTAHGADLVILGCLEGNLEAELHNRFKSDRRRGEWFKLSERLAAYLAELNFLEGPLQGIDKTPIVESRADLIADQIFDRSKYADEEEFQSDLLLAFDEAKDCECECYDPEEGDSAGGPQEHDDTNGDCPVTLWVNATDLLAHPERVDRVGINATARVIYVVLRPVNTDERREYLYSKLGDAAFNFDTCNWTLVVSAYDPFNWEHSREFAGIELFAERLRREAELETRL